VAITMGIRSKNISRRLTDGLALTRKFSPNGKLRRIVA
jgi:hypothetical protein